MKTPILGSSYVARSVNAADSRMVNLFPEVVLEGGKEPAFLLLACGLLLKSAAGLFGGCGNLATTCTLHLAASCTGLTATTTRRF